jgi:hypothetical protein
VTRQGHEFSVRHRANLLTIKRMFLLKLTATPVPLLRGAALRIQNSQDIEPLWIADSAAKNRSGISVPTFRHAPKFRRTVRRVTLFSLRLLNVLSGLFPSLIFQTLRRIGCGQPDD